jgi:transcriptional regulator with XRE-family HTH domain
MEERLSPLEQLSFDNASAWQDLRIAFIQRRLDLGLSQEALAQKMGLSQPAISQFEGVGANPRLMTIFTYAQALGLQLRFGASVVEKNTPRV